MIIVIFCCSSSSSGVFIDFFAPWCPPCMSLLPEFRKASTLIGGQITFGTVSSSNSLIVIILQNLSSYKSITVSDGGVVIWYYVLFSGGIIKSYSSGNRSVPCHQRMFSKVMIYIVAVYHAIEGCFPSNDLHIAAGGLYNPRPLVQPTRSPRVSHHRLLQQQQVWMIVMIKVNKMRMVKDKWWSRMPMFRPHKYEGGHRARDLADFVEDILRPVVVPLTVSDNVIAMTWH